MRSMSAKQREATHTHNTHMHTGLPGRQGGELFDIIGVEETASRERKKKALRQASLRWHPDKFLQAYGKRVKPCDRDRVMDSVKVMCQRVNQLKDRFEAEQ